MNWTEQQTATREKLDVDEARSRLLTEVRKESLPVVQKEASSGVRPFEKVDFQPIKGVNTFEAEFGVKGEDVIYHVWPWGYHEADRKKDERLPSFKRDFEKVLSQVMASVFGQGRCDLSFDADIGAWFVKVNGFGTNQFFRNVCIEAALALHKAMGGKD